ncbi:MAG: hypothetical protein FWE95_03105 [Planctomycetaceae bacterium]|nr:hypothetical protein [Planctomycetaceae bacterium]
MTMFSQFPFCRTFAALVFFGAFALAVQAQSRVVEVPPVAQPAASRTEALPEKDEKDEVVLYLGYSLGGPPLPGSTNKAFFFPQLIVWKDGRILFGQFKPTPERRFLDDTENWTYFWGKIDLQKVEELVKLFQKDFGFGKNGGRIVDVGPGGGTWDLQGVIDGKTYNVSTWEQFNNLTAESLANRPVSGQVDGVWGEYKTVDGKPLTLREFYDLWRQIKGDVIKWGEAVTKENSITVQVVVEGWKMTVKDKDGKVLVYVSSLNRR